MTLRRKVCLTFYRLNNILGVDLLLPTSAKTGIHSWWGVHQKYTFCSSLLWLHLPSANFCCCDPENPLNHLHLKLDAHLFQFFSYWSLFQYPSITKKILFTSLFKHHHSLRAEYSCEACHPAQGSKGWYISLFWSLSLEFLCSIVRHVTSHWASIRLTWPIRWRLSPRF